MFEPEKGIFLRCVILQSNERSATHACYYSHRKLSSFSTVRNYLRTSRLQQSETTRSILRSILQLFFPFFFLIDRGRDVIAHGSRKILDRPQRYRASLSRMHDRSAYGSETMRVVEAYCVAISDGIARQLILRVMFSPSVRFTRAKLQSDAESRLLLDA